MTLKVAALTGFSGAGKTTLLVQLIERYVREGLRVGAIKHTHHPLNETRTGDTARFQDAGGEPVILASEGNAVIFAGKHHAGVIRPPRGSARSLHGPRRRAGGRLQKTRRVAAGRDQAAIAP